MNRSAPTSAQPSGLAAGTGGRGAAVADAVEAGGAGSGGAGGPASPFTRHADDLSEGQVAALTDALARSRERRLARRRLILVVMLVVLALGVALTLMLGQSFTPLGDVVRVLMGQDVPGASFTVGRLRLPRATLSVVAGLSFGLAGAAYQTMLRNALASPDIIGISYSASAAAVVGIVFFSLRGTSVSTVAIVVSLGVALLIYLLAFKGGVNGTRLILIGIGIAAMLESVVAYSLSRAGEWNMQEAIRWLSGSVNGASWPQILPVLLALPAFGGVLLALTREDRKSVV